MFILDSTIIDYMVIDEAFLQRLLTKLKYVHIKKLSQAQFSSNMTFICIQHINET